MTRRNSVAQKPEVADPNATSPARPSTRRRLLLEPCDQSRADLRLTAEQRRALPGAARVRDTHLAGTGGACDQVGDLHRLGLLGADLDERARARVTQAGTELRDFHERKPRRGEDQRLG